MNPPTILNENQVQNFIDYIIQKGEMSLDFIKYLTFEWQVNPTQRKILQRLKKIVNIHDTNHALIFLLCSQGLNQAHDARKVIFSRNSINLQKYLGTIKLIMVHSKDFKFRGEKIAIIINKTIILLNNEDNSKLRISAFLLLGILYQNIRSRYFADMKHYLRDFVV